MPIGRDWRVILNSTTTPCLATQCTREKTVMSYKQLSQCLTCMQKLHSGWLKSVNHASDNPWEPGRITLHSKKESLSSPQTCHLLLNLNWFGFKDTTGEGWERNRSIFNYTGISPKRRDMRMKHCAAPSQTAERWEGGPCVRQKDRLTEGGSSYRRKRSDQWDRPGFGSQLTQPKASGLGRGLGKLPPGSSVMGYPISSVSSACTTHPPTCRSLNRTWDFPPQDFPQMFTL